MFRRLIIILCCASISNVGWSCYQPVTYLEAGEAAPCDGYLFSPDTEEQVRELKIDNDYLKSTVQNQKYIIRLQEEQKKVLEEVLESERQRAEVWKDASNDLSKIKPMSDTERVLYFVGGILTTVAAGYAIGQASK